MPLDERDLSRILTLIDERIEPVRIQRVEFEEVKGAIKDLQVEVAHMARAVEDLTGQIKALIAQVSELAQAQRRTERELASFREEMAGLRRDMVAQGERLERSFREELAVVHEELAGIREELAVGREEMAGFREGMAGFRQEMAGFRQEMASLRRDLVAQGERMEAFCERLDRNYEGLRREVGALSEAYGSDLEDIAIYIVPIYLAHELGFQVQELEPSYVRVDSEEIEIDLFGRADRGEEAWTIVGEAKSRVHVGEIETLVRRNRKVAEAIGGRVLQVLFPRRIHPRALEIARAEGIVVIPWDYQFRRRSA